LAGHVERLEPVALTGNFGCEAYALGGAASLAFAFDAAETALRSDLSADTVSNGALSPARVLPSDGSLISMWDTLSTTAYRTQARSHGSSSRTTVDSATDSRPSPQLIRSDLGNPITSSLSVGVFGNALFDAFDDFEQRSSGQTSSLARSSTLGGSGGSPEVGQAGNGGGSGRTHDAAGSIGPAAFVASGSFGDSLPPSSTGYSSVFAAPRSASADPPANQPPVAVNDSTSVSNPGSVTITTDFVLANDFDPDGDSLTATLGTSASNGTVVANADGSVTYTPNADFTGIDSIGYTVTDTGGLTANAIVEISVNSLGGGGTTDDGGGGTGSVGGGGTGGGGSGTGDGGSSTGDGGSDTGDGGGGSGGSANSAPVFGSVGPLSVAENTAAGTAIGAVTATDPDAGQTLTYSLSGNGPFGINSSTGEILVAGTLDYETPPTSFTFTVTAWDNGSPPLSASTDVTINVTNVNEKPVFNGTPYSFDVPEDAADGTVVGSVSASDPEGDSVTYSGGASPFSVDAAGNIVLSGSLDYETQTTYVLTVTAADSGSPSLSETASVTIHVTDVNEAPTVSSAPGNVTANEDDPDQTIGLGGVFTDPDAGDTLSYSASSDSGVVGASASGTTLTLSFPPDEFGAATITITATDSGGQSASASFAVTVQPVNDAPRFDAGPDVTVDEDSGPQSVNPWATNVVPGPANEWSQSVSFEITANSNAGLFSDGPTVDANGALWFTPAADQTGSANITLRAHDTGGTANGGVDTSAPITFAIAIGDVNDPPTFSAIGNQTVDEDAPEQSVSITGVKPGPPNESNQTVTLTVSSSNLALFATLTITGTGETRTLKYQPAPNANGAATITVTADDGQTQNNTFQRQFTITVNPVNDDPTAYSQTVETDEDTAVLIVLAGDDGDPEVAQTLWFNIVASPTHGTLTRLGSAGFEYTPEQDFNGTDSFTYTVTDDGTAGGPALTSSPPAKATIVIRPINDAPRFTIVPGQISVAEDADWNDASENWLGFLEARDVDTGDALSFSIISITPSGPFVLANQQTGPDPSDPTKTLGLVDLKLNGQIDYEKIASYSLTISVTDSGGNYANATVAISVIDKTFTGTILVSDLNFRGAGYQQVTADPGSNQTFGQWQWKDLYLDGTPDRQWPVWYVKGSTPTVDAKFWTRTAWTLGKENITIKATGPDSYNVQEFSLTIDQPRTLSNFEISASGMTFTKQLESFVKYYEKFGLDWKMSFDAGTTWLGVGRSEIEFFVTTAPSLASTNYHTVVWLGTKAGSGKFAAQGIIQAVGAAFSTRDIHRRYDDAQLSYVHPGATGAKELIRNGSSQCTGWAELMKWVIQAQGIDDVGTENVNSRFTGANQLYVRNWKHGTPGDFGYDAVISGGVVFEYKYMFQEGENTADLDGVPGQGPSPLSDDPTSIFFFHQIVKAGGLYYDPSYGTGPFLTKYDWADASLVGVGTDPNGSIVKFIPLKSFDPGGYFAILLIE